MSFTEGDASTLKEITDSVTRVHRVSLVYDFYVHARNAPEALARVVSMVGEIPSMHPCHDFTVTINDAERGAQNG